MKKKLSYIDNVLIKSMLKGDTRSIYQILLDSTESDHLSILIYAEHTSLLYQVDIDETIDTSKLDRNSLLGETFHSRKIGIYKHVASEKKYHHQIDNPYNTRLKSQIVVPILDEDELIGIIRFSKNTANRHIYTNKHIEIITMLIPTLIDVIYSFQPNKLEEVKAKNQCVSTEVEAEKEVSCVEGAIAKINSLLEYIAENTENAKVNKLLMDTEEKIAKINDILSNEYIAQNINRQNEDESDNNKKINIMIADDVKLNTTILEAMIKNREYIIHVAYDGDIALKKMEGLHDMGQSIDILFLDQNMPNMLGSEVVENIKRYHKNYTDDYITIVSITNDPDSISQNKHQYDYHIKKPFNKKEIKETMDTIKKKFDSKTID